MKPFYSCNTVLTLTAVAFVLGCSVSVYAGDKSLPATAAALPKSVFVDDVNNGKDPFFPNSTRRAESLPRIATTNVVAPANLVLDQLALKGISGTQDRRLALINSATLAVGELGEIKVGAQILKLRCREIRERSVLIELDGSKEVKELKLREGI